MNERKQKVLNITLSSLYGIFYTLMIFTIPIVFILLCRSFYFSQISYLNILDYLSYYGFDYTYLDVKEAYNALLDSLIYGYPFSEGVFYYSEEGMAHFLDCIPLFNLAIYNCLISSIGFITLHILKKVKVFTNLKVKGLSSLSLTPLVFVFIIIVFVFIALIDFNTAFTIFHSIFFPGKTNWIFQFENDPIILIFPAEFFMNCAIFIAIFFIIFAFTPLIKEIVKLIKEKRKSKDLQDNINS